MSGSIGKILDPIGALFIHKDAYDKAEKANDTPAASAPPKDESVLARADEFAAREQTVGQRASAAGAQRSDNEADLLGYVMPKKRSASRAILG